MTLTLEVLLKLLPLLVGGIGAALSTWLSREVSRMASSADKKRHGRRFHLEVTNKGKTVKLDLSGLSPEAAQKIERAAKEALR